jgi:hypothetical protein
VSTYFGNEMAPGVYADLMQRVQTGQGVLSDAQAQPYLDNAHALWQEKRFFHWELEFPEVFFDQFGRRKPNPGFDAVVGNPPYVRAETADKEQRAFLMTSALFETIWGRFDVFLTFVESGLHLLRTEGIFGMIVPSAILTINYAEKLRGLILQTKTLLSVADFRKVRVFEDALVSTCIPVVYNRFPSPDHKAAMLAGDREDWLTPVRSVEQRLF